MLSRNLYWLAIALLRLDRSEIALRSLASAQKLRPRSLARLAYVNRVNDYGWVNDRVRRSTISTHFIRSRLASTWAESREPVRHQRREGHRDTAHRGRLAHAFVLRCSHRLVVLGKAGALQISQDRVSLFWVASGHARKDPRSGFPRGIKTRRREEMQLRFGAPLHTVLRPHFYPSRTFL